MTSAARALEPVLTIRLLTAQEILGRIEDFRALTNEDDRESNMNLLLDEKCCGYITGTVAEQNGHIIGWTSAETCDCENILVNVYVHKGYRRQGIATQLARALLAEVAQRRPRVAVEAWGGTPFWGNFEDVSWTP